MKLSSVTPFALLVPVAVSATHFKWPAQFTQWENGGKGWFHLVGESCKSGSIKLIDSGGFAPKNLGYVAKDLDITGDDAFEFDIWDELPAGDTYQLGFYPNLDCGKATTAFSYYFTIKKKHEPSYEKNEQNKD